MIKRVAVSRFYVLGFFLVILVASIPASAVKFLPLVNYGVPRSVAGLALWFDASRAASISYGVGNRVTGLSDLSKNGNIAFQATGTKQPTVLTAAQNGLNTIQCSAPASQALTLKTSATLNSGYTVVGVFAHYVPVSGSNIFELLGTSVRPTVLEWYSDNMIYSAPGPNEIYSTPVTGTAYHLVTLQFNGPSGFVRVDRVNVTNTVSTSATTTVYTTICQGDSVFSNGAFAEFVVYDNSIHVVTTAEVTMLETYLRNKWGTP